ncbi:fimbria/pilus chaperone family protein [Erwinia pyrifoliae]|uniref:Fimbria/pilus chaperone family protein n=1 Tax=Erwinia pyrifoliae TaxID=79967 RepID=A0ABY5XE61_ERWPY|nr:fimbria/pilus chaperone family protein [Erwinia pyrifoliae]AUX72793.1 fimbrial protein [Erwinia pyrifoliae]MCA8876944.1 fimbria/pilus periplasmic chaperone [Erwinia pyrifoliae]MCT2387096.1 fimbria/pilus chaperone family protein [Erwinia pyrifoliae]MCU8587305.1 fimbria/pilus chaperone family protein [Erwinia pyrifoliae]UWS31762.1 fimbria/pilus chaperone family protein [Erwinia pyrifoliae]
MTFSTYCAAIFPVLGFFAPNVNATGILPETSVVIVEEEDGEGAINLKNTDAFPVLLLTNLQDIEPDTGRLITITPPAARVEPGKTQRVRFILTSKSPLKTEHLMRVAFEGVPPQEKGKSVVRMTVRQNLPVIIRPSGLKRDKAPWKRLIWTLKAGRLSVSNPSPYVVRLGQSVTTLPQGSSWSLPHAWILPGQQLTLSGEDKKAEAKADKVRFFPANTWGFAVDSYDAPLASGE